MIAQPQKTHRAVADSCQTDAVRLQAESLLRECSDLFNRGITCEFHEGVLILRGRVRRYYHKQIAQTIVGGVDGVEQVINHIEVDDSAD